MVPKVSVLVAHPELPHELYRDIIENLHHLRERDTLLCLALVSKALCAESQRVLFRTVGDSFTDMDERESVIREHTLFLKGIIRNPTRLGPYVQTYRQYELICHPFLAKAGVGSYLWDLTAKALPSFVNLKHLFIVPTHGNSKTPPVSLLDGCTFKLESLRWGFESLDDPSSTDSLIEFLRTQHDLLHLEVGYYPLRQQFSWLPDNICPSLMSATCQLDSAARVMAKSRNVVGLKIWSKWHPSQLQATLQSHLSALRRLKYLSILIPYNLMPEYWGMLDRMDAVLLELMSWNLKTVQNLSGLPNLRVLVLLGGPREARFIGSMIVDANAEYSLQMQLATEGFRRCPKLEYIIIEHMRTSQVPKRYSKFFLTTLNRAHNIEQEIQSEEFLVEREVGMSWWTAYGVSGKIC